MKLKNLLIGAALTAMTPFVYAAGYMPFVLANVSTESVDAAAAKAEAAVKSKGFEVVGSYQPVNGVKIIVITNDALKNMAAESKNGGFGAMERIAVVARDGQTQISYTNPSYWWNAYRMKGDIAPVQSSLSSALGNMREFGADEPLSADDLREYHYKMMMPYFDDVDELADYDNHAEGVQTVEANLAANKGGVKKVYRIDIPGGKMTVFGVELTKGDGADANILKQIDTSDLSHAAHLPYELLVVDDEAVALNGKFRIAISWPSLSMMGSNSFMSISGAPDSIEESLEEVAKK
jgi:hypothetical protein